MEKNKKLYELRNNIYQLEKLYKINQLSEKSKIIFSYLLTMQNIKTPINSLKENELISKYMSNSSFNRAIKELRDNNKISIEPNARDKRSQNISLILK